MPTPSERGATDSHDPIPLCEPEIRGNEWAYLKECLDTNWVSSGGAFVDRFEAGVAAYVGTRHATATNSGTAALHIALLIAGVRPDDEVLVPSLTFIAPANAVRYAGAWPVFIDAEPDYWQMDPDQVVRFLTDGCETVRSELRSKGSGRRISAILPVHILGHPVDIAPIVGAGKRFGLAVVEDATESLGARYKDVAVGHLADAACFSFNGNKLLTTGAGGMIVTDNEAWAQRARYLTTQAKDDPVEYVHGEIGYNYRLSNLQAAVGCAQLEQIDDYLSAKRQIAERYSRGLGQVPGITLMPEAGWASSARWLYTIMVDEAGYGSSSRELQRQLASLAIETRPLWQPLDQSPVYRAERPSALPVANRLAERGLSLPSSVGLTPTSQERVIDAIVSHRSVN